VKVAVAPMPFEDKRVVSAFLVVQLQWLPLRPFHKNKMKGKNALPFVFAPMSFRGKQATSAFRFIHFKYWKVHFNHI
jgi:hypothetical protein